MLAISPPSARKDHLNFLPTDAFPPLLADPEIQKVFIPLASTFFSTDEIRICFQILHDSDQVLPAACSYSLLANLHLGCVALVGA